MSMIDTPCVGVCSTVYGDDICRGCKRTYDEVIDWNRFDDAGKEAIYARLTQDAETVVNQFLTITDPDRLRAALDQQTIRYRPDHPAATWVLQWLRFTRIDAAWETVGIFLHPPYQNASRKEMFTLIDDALYAHACGLPA